METNDIIKTNKPNVLEDEDAFYNKWSSPVLLGPFIHALYALLVIFSGQLLLATWTGTCGYALDAFVGAAMAMCYLFLIVYSWIFIGDYVRLQIPVLKIDIGLLYPFKSLQMVIFFYSLLIVGSFIVWIVGSILFQLSSFCAATAPSLYQFTFFLIVTYWLGLIITAIYVIKLFFGTNIVKVIKEKAREKTIEEVEIELFIQNFQSFDTKKSGRITTDQLPALLEKIGVFIPESEIITLQQTLDNEETGFIEFDKMLEWFKKLNDSLGDFEDGEDLNDPDSQSFAKNRNASKSGSSKKKPARK